MELFDPFAKNYGRPIEAPPVRILTALVPTGAHVGSANDLVHVRNRSGGGGPATKLERYKGHGTKLGRKFAGSVHKRGEQLVRTGRIAGTGPSSAVAGRVRTAMASPTFKGRAHRRNLAMEQLRSQVGKRALGAPLIFQDGRSTGRRIA